MAWLLGALWRLVRIVDFLIFTLVAWLLSWLAGRNGSTWFRPLFRAWCRSFVAALGVDLRLHQRYPGWLPPQFVLVSNHPSALEDVGVPALFDVDSLAKGQVVDWWWVGRLACAAGTLFVDRDDADSRQRAVEDMVARLDSGRSIAVYPEGGCKGRRVQPRFHLGAFEASMRTGVPILPVLLHYEAQADFEWQGQPLLLKIWQIASSRNRTAHIHVFAPMQPGDYKDARQFRDAVHARYMEWQARFLDQADNGV
ncbi:1-acyl-sn-glycerol-3-phosphate acyltransferase [Natronocella acetinitrilica]|uniref:1-acyl-sn-glycerol-3-phosphate acyltransferase n=1 Tax=Natronocella acetinitrilica TaxID=414046 RepID=A0AAE3G5N0_9GAMM|nr:lysophospholipid acyltransferase family protein [Natronocella acetinitrilica]MCP1676245.1 1-acyl-sn-glycerol-3-phosphate acyltransferase [Natronocella acetinitrilica]